MFESIAGTKWERAAKNLIGKIVRADARESDDTIAGKFWSNLFRSNSKKLSFVDESVTIVAEYCGLYMAKGRKYY